MSHAPVPVMRREGEIDRRPWGLILGLTLVLMIGAVGLPLQVVTFSRINQASKADQLTRGQQALCQQLNDLARQAGLKPYDCSQLGKK